MSTLGTPSIHRRQTWRGCVLLLIARPPVLKRQMWSDAASVSVCDGAGRGLDCGSHVALGMKARCHANLCMYAS